MIGIRGENAQVGRPAVCGGLNLTYGSPTDSGGGYAGLDPASYTTLRRACRFGRVIDQKWQTDGQ